MKKESAEGEKASSRSLLSQRESYEKEIQGMAESLRSMARSSGATPVDDASGSEVVRLNVVYDALLTPYSIFTPRQTRKNWKQRLKG